MTQRLPVVGSDVDSWGSILNGYLSVSLNSDGTLNTTAVSTAGAEMTSHKGAASGYAGLNASTVVPTAQLGSGTASSSNFLRGDNAWAVPAYPVTSVASKTGAVTLATTDLTDTNIVSPSNTQVLTYNSTSGKWENQATAVTIDATATDIQPLGTRAAGSVGKAADAGHVHAMPRLDQVSAPTASVSLNSQKITSLANGSVSTDAAAFGQIPTALPPNGSAGGDLSGTYPNPTVAKVNGITVSGTPSSNQVLTATSGTAASWSGVAGANVSGPVTKRVNTLSVSSNTYTPDCGTTDIALITSPTAGFTIANPTSTPSDGQSLIFRIKSSGSTFTPTWGTNYLSTGITLPTTLVASKTVTVGLMYDASATKWICLATETTGY